MTTHRRAWKQRAGAVVALIVGAVFALPASPALADDPTVQISNLSTGSLRSGERATLQFTVKNNNPAPTPFSITVTVFNGLSCQGDCNIPARMIDGNGGSQTFNATLVAGNLAAGQTQSGKVIVAARSGGDRGSDERDMSVRGPDQPPPSQTVKEISGKVTNQSTGDPVAGAIVMITDSQNHKYEATTGSSGSFRFTGSEQKPITPGSVQIGALKDEAQVVKTINVAAGQSLTGYRLVLKVPDATPTATTEAEPTVDPTAEETPGDTGGAAAPSSNNSESGGMGSLLLILVGGLLVALGVGAIVLLLLRRKEGDTDDEAGAPATPRPGVPGSRGVYAGADDPTRMVNRAGVGADPTMVARPSIADAPTMMHGRPLVDEFPDPYGAPLPPPQPQGPQPPAYGQPGWAGSGYGGAPTQVGYGASPGGYGNPPSSGGGYGNAPSSGGGYGGQGNAYGNAPASGGGYGAGPGGYGNAPSSGGGYGNAPSSGGGYGGPAPRGDGYGDRDYGAPKGQSGPGYGGQPRGGYDERYDEPTGHYDGGGYGQASYQSGPYDSSGTGRGYGQEQPYGRDAGGRDAGQGGRGGYGSNAGGYDAGDGYSSGGYDQQGYGAGPGYDRSSSGGYDERSGYDRVPEQRDGGYDARGYDQGGYYDESAQGGGRRGAPQQPSRSERRSLDWLDD